MKFLYEPLNGGMVTSKDPSRLEPGEFVAATGCFFYDDCEALSTVPAVSDWSEVNNHATVFGLASCRFDSGDHYLLAQAASAFHLADAETDNSSFTQSLTGLSGTSTRLTTLQMDNRHYVFNGVDRNKVLLEDGTFRSHGVIPVSVAAATATISALPFNGSATGYYEYWWTEAITYPDGQQLEGTFTAKPLVVQITATANQAPIIHFNPSPANAAEGASGAADSIKYFVYRSEAKATVSESLYPIGIKVGEADVLKSDGSQVADPVFIDSTTASNTGAKTGASSLNTTLDTDLTRSVTETLVGGPASVAAACATSGDSKYVRYTVAGGTVRAFHPLGANLGLYNFSIGTLGAGVVGIQVNVSARTSTTTTPATLSCRIGEKTGSDPGAFNAVPYPGGVAFPETKSRPITSTASFATYSFGSPTDRWIRTDASWPITQFGNNFMVSLDAEFGPGAVAGTTIDIDYVELLIYYNAAISSVQQDNKLYDAVVTEEDGVELKFGANDRPPISSTGCVFEGSMVVNDVDNPRRFFWSTPGSGDAFPVGVYWIDLPPIDNDQITYLGVINNRMVVGMRGSLWRVNYLPNQADASYSRGRAYELISDRVGILNQNAVCRFTGPGGTQELAFVDSNGIFSTNGYSIRPLSSDLRWVDNMSGIFGSITTSMPDQVIALINDPGTKNLRLVLSSGKIHSGNYSPTHDKQGQPKWAGPTLRSPSSSRPASAAVIRRSSGVWIPIYGMTGSGTTGGLVLREDAADTPAVSSSTTSGRSTAMTVVTRDIFPNGLMGAAQLTGILLHARDRGDGTSISTAVDAAVTITEIHEGQAENSVSATVPASNAQYLAEIGLVANSRGVRLTVAPTTATLKEIQGIVLELTDFNPAGHNA